MGEIFRELQEESKERETRGAFERWLTEKRGTPLLLEQTQAYEAFKAGMKHYGCMTAVRMFQAEEAVLAKPETAEPVAWQARIVIPGKQSSSWGYYSRDDAAALTSDPMYEVRPLYAYPPRDEWRLASEPPDSDRDVLLWTSNGGLTMGFHDADDGWIPSRFVTHWRDVHPPTEGEP